MTGKSFIDTNVLVWSVDKSDVMKHRRASSIVRSNEIHVISTQVMMEYYTTCVRKLGADAVDVRNQLQTLVRLEIVSATPELVLEAADLSLSHKISFWDAAIVAAAKRARCATLLTEDLNHGQVIGGVRVHNPFLED